MPSKHLIEEAAEQLKAEIQEPDFTKYVKSGVHKERAPQRTDWFYVRMGSILYRAYKWNVIGTNHLRTYYGGRKRRGVKTEHQRKASGKVIRTAVQKLEQAGYLERAKPKGRKLSGKGQKFLNEISKIVAKNMQEGKYTKKAKIRKDDAQSQKVKEELRKQESEKKQHDKPKDKQKPHKEKKGDAE